MNKLSKSNCKSYKNIMISISYMLSVIIYYHSYETFDVFKLNNKINWNKY